MAFKDFYVNKTNIDVERINTILEALYIPEVESVGTKIGKKSADSFSPGDSIKFSGNGYRLLNKNGAYKEDLGLANTKFTIVTPEEYKEAVKKKTILLFGFKTVGQFKMTELNSINTDEEVYVPKLEGIQSYLGKFGIRKEDSNYVMPGNKVLEFIKSLDSNVKVIGTLYLSADDGVYYRVVYNKLRDNLAELFNDSSKVDEDTDKAIDKKNIKYDFTPYEREIILSLGALYNVPKVYDELNRYQVDSGEELDLEAEAMTIPAVRKAIAPLLKALESADDLRKETVEKLAINMQKYPIEVILQIVQLSYIGYKFYTDICSNNINKPYIVMETLDGKNGIKNIIREKFSTKSPEDDGVKVSTIDFIISSMPAKELAAAMSKYSLAPKVSNEDGYVEILNGNDLVGVFYSVTAKLTKKSQIGRAKELFSKMSGMDLKKDIETLNASYELKYDDIIMEGIFDKLSEKAKAVFESIKSMGKKLFDLVSRLSAGLKKNYAESLSFLKSDVTKNMYDGVKFLTEAETYVDKIRSFLTSSKDKTLAFDKINDRINGYINILQQRNGNVFMTNIKKYERSALDPNTLKDSSFINFIYSHSFIKSMVNYIDTKVYNRNRGDLKELIEDVVELYIEATFGQSFDIPLWKVSEAGDPVYKYLGTRSSHKEKTIESISPEIKKNANLPVVLLHDNIAGGIHNIHVFILIEYIDENMNIDPKYARIRFGVDERNFSVDIAADGTVGLDDDKVKECLGKAVEQKKKK
jgi:hypothetical protein